MKFNRSWRSTFVCHQTKSQDTSRALKPSQLLCQCICRKTVLAVQLTLLSLVILVLLGPRAGARDLSSISLSLNLQAADLLENLGAAGEELNSSAEYSNDNTNVPLVELRRQMFDQICQSRVLGPDDKKRALDQLVVEWNTVESASTPTTPAARSQPYRCTHVFWDFGSNVGDSLDKFITAGYSDLTCGKQGELVSGVRMNLETGRLETYEPKTAWYNFKSLNKLIMWTSDHMVGKPEQYCYYGVEGNPKLSTLLHGYEDRTIRRTHPRPLRNVHFFTETVVTNKPGNITFFLQERTHAVGSSILQSKIEKQKTPLLPTTVEGITIPMLINTTLDVIPGLSHLLVKMDIEGAEYQVLDTHWHTLCDLSQSGVAVDMLLELHGSNKIGRSNPDMRTFHRTHVLRQLHNCGVSVDTGKFLLAGSVA